MYQITPRLKNWGSMPPHRLCVQHAFRKHSRDCVRALDRTGEQGIIWLRGLDSNQDNQLQRLACYQLHYPGLVSEIVADIL